MGMWAVVKWWNSCPASTGSELNPVPQKNQKAHVSRWFLCCALSVG
jgi:hypothetical protein